MPRSESLRLGIMLALMTLFLIVAFVGAVAQVSGVVIGAGVMTAVLALAFVFSTMKEAIDMPVA